MGWKTRTTYVDGSTGEIILIPKWELYKWEVTTDTIVTTKINLKDYEKEIIKLVKPSRQRELEFD